MGLFSGPGVTPSLKGMATNRYGLEAGAVSTIFPAGWYMVRTGKYGAIQQFDPIMQAWRTIGGGVIAGGAEYIYSDGVNYRVANQTGCAVGALLTAAGSGYTSAPTVTASAGNSIWRAIVGGALNTTVTVTNGGANYTYPPQVVIAAPPAGGIQAEGYCTLSGGAVSTVTITDQGAGYSSAPTINFINDPREGVNGVTQGYGAAAVAILTGSGTVTGVVCIDHGTPLTSVPTLSFSGGGGSSAAATAIMCWSITAFSPSAGTGFTGNSNLSGLDAFPTTAAAYTNPATQSGLVQVRLASILLPESGGAPTATGAVFYDGGIYTSTPTPLVTTNGALITETATFTFTMGGVKDGYYLTPV